MRRRSISISDFAAIALLLILVYHSFIIVREHKQKENQTQTLKQSDMFFFQKESNFLAWKTIESGTFSNTDAIRKALIYNGFKIEYWASDIFHKTPVSRKKTKLELVLVSAGQLGFKDWVPYKDIVKRAQELGLELVPAEAGPQLRLQYPAQPKDEWLHMAMEPLIDSNGDLTIFDVMRNDFHTHNNKNRHAQDANHDLQLCSSSVRHDVLWSPSSQWVFLK